MAGGPYNIPRNYKGEGKILYIFSYMAFGFTVAGIVLGAIFYYLIFNPLGLTIPGIAVIVLLGFIGFALATFKIPDSKKFNFTVKTGGENILEILKRWIKFKNKHNRIYVYKDNSTNEEVK